MIVLLPIGFGLMVLGVRLRLVRRTLNRGQVPTTETLAHLLREGQALLVGGLAILAVAVIWEFAIAQFPGFSVVLGTGSSMAYMSLPALLQWIVGRRRGTERQICIWEGILLYGGTLLVMAFIVYTIVTSLM